MIDYPRKSSASQMRTLNDCPRKYHYRYIERIPEPKTGIALPHGNAVHAAMQLYYEALRDGFAPPSVDDMKAVAQAEFERRLSQIADKGGEVEFAYVDKKKSNQRQTARDSLAWIGRAVDAFAANPYIPAQVIDVEHEFALNIEKYGRQIIGYIDLIARDRDGSIIVVDHKTGSRSPSTERTFDADGKTIDTGMLGRPDLQMSIYELAVRALFPGESISLAHQKVAVLKTKASCGLYRFDQRGRYIAEALESIASNFELLELLTNRFESKILFRRLRSDFCKTCSYLDICDEDLPGAAKKGIEP